MSGGKIIKHLLAKNGPMTTNTLAEHIPQFKEELVSKSHMKKHILGTLERQNILHKQIHRSELPKEKPVWLWTFTESQLAEKYKDLPQGKAEPNV